MRKLTMTGLALAVLACWLLLTTPAGREAGASAMRRHPRALLPVVMYQPTPTPTDVPVPSLSGRVFFDYNGNGLQDAGEPGIPDVPVCIDSLGSGLCSTSRADGSYSIAIASVTAGTHDVYVQSPTDEPATAFRYINRFLGWVDIPAYEMNGVQVPAQHLADTEFQPIAQPLSVELSGDRSLDIALMQGFLTLPYRAYDAHSMSQTHGFDHDGRVGHVLGYDGSTLLIRIDPLNDPQSMNREGIEDGHTGVDYILPDGTSIIAMAPGVVSHLALPGPHDDLTYFPFVAVLDHGLRDPDLGGITYQTVYGHLQTYLVATNQHVHRGQVLGLSGHTGGGPYPVSHLHLDFLFGPQNPPEPDDYLPAGFQKDPFGVVATVPVHFAVERYSSWTLFNDSQCPF